MMIMLLSRPAVPSRGLSGSPGSHGKLSGAMSEKSNFGGPCEIEGVATQYVNLESKFTNCDANATKIITNRPVFKPCFDYRRIARLKTY